MRQLVDGPHRSVDLEQRFRVAGGGESIAVFICSRTPNGRRADGRILAGVCLSALEQIDTNVGRGPHREPLWPTGVTGSITHTDGMTLVVVCLQSATRAISVGVDVERVGNVTAELFPTVFTAKERDVLASVDGARRDAMAATGFSAKEAFYKAQFPMTGRFVEFDELEVDFTDAGIRVEAGPADLHRLSSHAFATDLDDAVVAGVVIHG